MTIGSVAWCVAAALQQSADDATASFHEETTFMLSRQRGLGENRSVGATHELRVLHAQRNPSLLLFLLFLRRSERRFKEEKIALGCDAHDCIERVLVYTR